jgi:biopolymer transport protein ExbB
MILLQVTQVAVDTVANAANAAQSSASKMSILDLLWKGGWVMLPIGILSVLAVYFAIERYLVINKASKVDPTFMANIRDYLLSGKMDAAATLCKNTNTPIARLLQKGLKRIGKPIDEIESAVESEGQLEMYKLEKNMNFLGIIAGIAPMFGFLGTIMGVIKIFFTISLTNNISISTISGGLYEKMITSAAGLVVGIFAHICFHLLNSMIDRVSFQIETSAVEFIDLIQEPSSIAV